LDDNDDAMLGELSDDEDDDGEDMDLDRNDTELQTISSKKQTATPTGIQQKYVCYLQRRIQLELSRNFPALDDKWLLNYLRKNDWVVLKRDALSVAEKLGLHKPVDGQIYHPNYYPVVHFWLPDVRWGEHCMPCCPNCKTNHHVGVHGFRDNHFGRMIVGLHENYYAISRRYKCRHCKQQKVELESRRRQSFD